MWVLSLSREVGLLSKEGREALGSDLFLCKWWSKLGEEAEDGGSVAILYGIHVHVVVGDVHVHIVGWRGEATV